MLLKKVLIGHIGRLPNITSGIWSGMFAKTWTINKALKLHATQMANILFSWNTNSDWDWKDVYLDASGASSIYQNNALPESKSLSLKYWLRNA